MNNITLYVATLHNANHYAVLSQAAAAFSAAISQRLAGMAAQNAKLAEILFAEALNGDEAIEPISLYAFDINFEREPQDYIVSILDAVIEAEDYLEGIFKHYGMKGFENIAFFRVNDFRSYKKAIEDGSLFGDVGKRVDFVCTSCGYTHSDTTHEQHKYMPETCPLCDAEQSAFIRRPFAGGW